MRLSTAVFARTSLLLIVMFSLRAPAQGQNQPEGRVSPALRTPLKPEIVRLLADEVSGQRAYNNEVRLAGAPWLRDPAEFSGTLYEARVIHDLVRGYGIDTTRLERYPADGTFDYPLEGELWVMEPDKRLVARLGADAALIARGSRTSDLTGELVYVPPLSEEDAKKMVEAGPQDKYRGKVALMWSHARDEAARALDAAGIVAVLSFSSRDRFFDPDQVVYSSGAYDTYDNLKLGMTISWRQWSELQEDLEAGKKITVRARARVEKYPDKFETVYSWIPGTEPDAKGVVFTAHLFEGYVKRGANDDMSGCVVQLEILRTLSKLIASGELPRPRRTIHFLWPNEISGTYEFIKQHPGFAGRLSININMDMVGEWLRKNNSLFTMSECPGHLPSYLDGLAKSFMNYVWRTNDIVYLPDSPRGRPGGQYFPIPMVEKNGSNDAFRFYIHRATGGSDHICFNNPSVAVPGIEFFTWPDQWYHADTDTPDKSDPTEMKRVAFIGAAMAWSAADCTDELLGGLLDAVSEFGYARVAEREIPQAMARIEAADAAALTAETGKALNLVDYGVRREIGALKSLEEIYTASPAARNAVAGRVTQWRLYGDGLRSQVLGYAKARAAQIGAAEPVEPRLTDEERKYASVVPAVAPSVKGREFQLTRRDSYEQYLKEHPDFLKDLGLSRQQTAAVLNYVNGRRSVTEIRNDAAAELNEDIALDAVVRYLEMLKSVDWIVY